MKITYFVLIKSVYMRKYLHPLTTTTYIVIHYEFTLALDGFHLPSLQHIRVPKTMK